MKEKLRLLLFPDCNRNCPGCCNKDWNLDSLPMETNFSGYKEIILTGGEPMLKPVVVHKTIQEIREQNEDAKIFLYTALTTPYLNLVLPFLDGITLTFHEQEDADRFKSLSWVFIQFCPQDTSKRLHVFSGININGLNLDGWDVKTGMEWIENCPLPEGEVFKRL